MAKLAEFTRRASKFFERSLPVDSVDEWMRSR
jgi:hypothetical protein